MLKEAEREILKLLPKVTGYGNEHGVLTALLESQAILNRNIVANNLLLEEQNKILKEILNKE